MAISIGVYLADLPRSLGSHDVVQSTLNGFLDQTIGNHKLDVTLKVTWANSKHSYYNAPLRGAL